MPARKVQVALISYCLTTPEQPVCNQQSERHKSKSKSRESGAQIHEVSEKPCDIGPEPSLRVMRPDLSARKCRGSRCDGCIRIMHITCLHIINARIPTHPSRGEHKKEHQKRGC